MHLKVSQILPQTGMQQLSKKDPAGWDNHHAIEFLEEEVCAGLIPEIDGDNSWPLQSLRRQLGAKRARSRSQNNNRKSNSEMEEHVNY